MSVVLVTQEAEMGGSLSPGVEAAVSGDHTTALQPLSGIEKKRERGRGREGGGRKGKERKEKKETGSVLLAIQEEMFSR